MSIGSALALALSTTSLSNVVIPPVAFIIAADMPGIQDSEIIAKSCSSTKDHRRVQAALRSPPEPTARSSENPLASPDRAWRNWHFVFHGIPDRPELLIAGREGKHLDWFCIATDCGA